jgi:hypothetical protein
MAIGRDEGAARPRPLSNDILGIAGALLDYGLCINRCLVDMVDRDIVIGLASRQTRPPPGRRPGARPYFSDVKLLFNMAERGSSSR